MTYISFVECLSYSELSNAERRVTTAIYARLCDVNSLVPGWFRFQGDAGTKMPITCPEKYSCGTDAPGWLNGAHPTMAEGQVTRQVCFHWGSSCCQWAINIQVTNCHSYYVYYLSKPPTCILVYCGSHWKPSLYKSHHHFLSSWRVQEWKLNKTKMPHDFGN